MNDQRWCPVCERSLHHSRFRSWRRHDVMSTSIAFRPVCKACEQKLRNEKRNEDRPLAIIQDRARTAARKAHVSFDFMWTNMNYRALVPVLRAMVGPDGRCLSCGHEFLGEPDIQIEHRFPPRSQNDYARLHARNLMLMCGSCNRGKSRKDPAQWLDEQEDARVANESVRELTLWTGHEPLRADTLGL